MKAGIATFVDIFLAAVTAQYGVSLPRNSQNLESRCILEAPFDNLPNERHNIRGDNHSKADVQIFPATPTTLVEC